MEQVRIGITKLKITKFLFYYFPHRDTFLHYASHPHVPLVPRCSSVSKNFCFRLIENNAEIGLKYIRYIMMWPAAFWQKCIIKTFMHFARFNSTRLFELHLCLKRFKRDLYINLFSDLCFIISWDCLRLL